MLSHLLVRLVRSTALVCLAALGSASAAHAARDETPPQTPITSGPSGTITSTSASFLFTSSEPGSFQCRLDGNSWAGCSSPKTYSGLANGSHAFAVRAIDPRNNIDPTPAASSFTVDQVIPSGTTTLDTVITAGPTGTISTASTSFSFSSSTAGATFACRLDAGTWSGCMSPMTYTGLSDGGHAFDVRASDAAGNTDPSPATRSFSIATSTAGTCGFGTFSFVSLPGACWRPYADSAPWNRGTGSAPTLLSNSSAIVSRLNGFGPPDDIDVGTTEDWSHPVYYSQPSDPVFTVHCTKGWGTCEVEGAQVRIPDAARAASGGDGHMTVVDQTNLWEYDFWQVQSRPSGGGTLSISWGGKTRIATADSDGLGSDATAGHFGLLAGVIRPAELEAGRINHALFMVVKCTNGGYVWPAESPDARACSSLGLSNTAAPANGQFFMLAMSHAEIDALRLPAWKTTILEAMADYGMFVGDTGGGAWGIQFESSASYTSFGQPDPWVKLGDSYGVPRYPDPTTGPVRIFRLRDGVDWTKLRAVDPCVARGIC